jgi:uncharacterized protein
MRTVFLHRRPDPYRDRDADSARVSRPLKSSPLRAGLHRLAALAFIACATIASAQKLAPIPSPSVRVNDNASLLGSPEEAALDDSLTEYEQTKGTKIVVLTIASTAPEQIEQYGARAAEAWKIGSEGGAGDVLIIIARDNRADLRRVRIEVRRELRERLPDEALARIINEDMTPHFQVLDYSGGLVAAIDHIKLLVEGGSLPPSLVPQPAAVEQSQGPAVGIVAVVLGVVGFLVACALVFGRMTARRMCYLAGNRTLNRAFSPMIVGRIGGKRVVEVGGDDGTGNGFGGGYVGPGVGGYAGGGGDFGGGGASGDW